MKQKITVRGFKENTKKIFSFIDEAVFDSCKDKNLCMNLKIVCEEIFFSIIENYSKKTLDIDLDFESDYKNNISIKFIYDQDQKDILKDSSNLNILKKLISKLEYSYVDKKNQIKIENQLQQKKLLEIIQKQEDQKVFLDLVGRVDTNTSKLLDQKFAEIFNQGLKNISVNLNDVDYLSSTGLRAFLSAQKSVNKLGGSMVLENLSNDVYSVFELTGFTSIMKINKK